MSSYRVGLALSQGLGLNVLGLIDTALSILQYEVPDLVG